MKPICEEFQKSKFDFMTKLFKTKQVNGSIIFIKKEYGFIWVFKWELRKSGRWWNGYLKVNLIKKKRKVMDHNLQDFFN